jgi:AcrR family transcriptional regulator
MSEVTQHRPGVRRARGRPRLDDVAAIDRKLLAVALRQFISKGYGATSMSSIAVAAHVSKTTLYARYTSKEQMFHAITRQQIDRFSTAAALRSDVAPLDLERGLKSYAQRTLEVGLKGDILEINRLIFGEANRFPELAAAAAERTRLGIEQIAQFIRECAVRDGIACRDPDAIAEVFILTLRGWYLNVMLANDKVPEPVRERFVECAVHALISARKDW